MDRMTKRTCCRAAQVVLLRGITPILIVVLVFLIASMAAGESRNGSIFSYAEDTATFTAENGVTYTYVLIDPSDEAGDTIAEITGLDSGSLPADWDGTLDIPADVGYPVKRIGQKAFYVNNKITRVIVPEGVEMIGSDCFNTCSKLASISLPSTLVSLGASSLSSTAITEIQLPDKLEQISDYTFFYCGRLSSVKLPAGLTHIGEYAFSECTKLTDVSLPDSLVAVKRCAFGHTGIRSITIPKKLTDIGDAVFERCIYLTEINVDKSNWQYCSIDGNLYTADGRKMLQYPLGRTLEEYTVPAGTVEIGTNAFRMDEELKKVILPEGVTAIGDYAFMACISLEEIVLPDSLRSIGTSAFDGCWKLFNEEGAVLRLPESLVQFAPFALGWCGIRAVEIPGSVEKIEDAAFYFCTSLEKVVIAKGTTEIGDDVFAECSRLSEIHIPSTVTAIGSDILSNAGSALAEGENIKVYAPAGTAAEDFALSDTDSMEFIAIVEPEDDPAGDTSGDTAPAPAAQAISVTASRTCTYGSRPFALGAKAKTPMTYVSSNPKVATVSDTGQVTLKGVGTAVITINAKGTAAYRAAQAKVTIRVRLAKAKIKAKNLRKRKVKISWAKVAGADGYEVYIKSPGGKKYVKRATRKARVKAITHSGLKKGKTYRYKVRAFRKVNGKKVYGAFSKVKKIRIKK